MNKELAGKEWWGRLSPKEQEAYLKEHPKSSLSKLRKAIKDKIASTAIAGSTMLENNAKLVKAWAASEKHLNRLKKIDFTATVTLAKKGAKAVRNGLSSLASKLENFVGGVSRDDRTEIEYDLNEANKSEGKERMKAFTKAALKLTLAAGIATLAIGAFATLGGPGILFIPELIANVWNKSKSATDTTVNLFATMSAVAASAIRVARPKKAYAVKEGEV